MSSSLSLSSPLLLLLSILLLPSFLLSQPPLPTPSVCASLGYDLSPLSLTDLSYVGADNVTVVYRACGFITSTPLCTANSTSLTLCILAPSNASLITSPPTLITAVNYDPLSPAIHWTLPSVHGVYHQLQGPHNYFDLIQFYCNVNATIPYITAVTSDDGAQPVRLLIFTAAACNPPAQPQCGWNSYNLTGLTPEMTFTAGDASQWVLHPCGAASLPSGGACNSAAVCTNAGIGGVGPVNGSTVTWDATAVMWWQEANGIAMQMSEGDGNTLIVHFQCQAGVPRGSIVNASLTAVQSVLGRVDEVYSVIVGTSLVCPNTSVGSSTAGVIGSPTSVQSVTSSKSMPSSAAASSSLSPAIPQSSSPVSLTGTSVMTGASQSSSAVPPTIEASSAPIVPSFSASSSFPSTSAISLSASASSSSASALPPSASADSSSASADSSSASALSASAAAISFSASMSSSIPTVTSSSLPPAFTSTFLSLASSPSSTALPPTSLSLTSFPAFPSSSTGSSNGSPVPIPPAGDNSSSSSLSTGGLIGVIVGSVVGGCLLICILILVLCLRLCPSKPIPPPLPQSPRPGTNEERKTVGGATGKERGGEASKRGVEMAAVEATRMSRRETESRRGEESDHSNEQGSRTVPTLQVIV